MSEMELEQMLESFGSLAIADTRLFFKVIESQGFDLWLTQASLVN